MNKREFLRTLSRALSPLTREEKRRLLDYYGELIDDRVEAGVPETAVIADLGDPRETARELVADAALRGEVREGTKPLPTALIILGSPLWLALFICVLAVILSVYVVAWALILSLAAVVLALALCGLAGLASLFLTFSENPAAAVALLGAGLLCTGLALLLAWPVWKAAQALSRGTARFCGRLWARSFGRFTKRRSAR